MSGKSVNLMRNLKPGSTKKFNHTKLSNMEGSAVKWTGHGNVKGTRF